ncbi:MAG: hypothetical protein ACXVB9_12485 [Bdellovibrionota bacterium]
MSHTLLPTKIRLLSVAIVTLFASPAFAGAPESAADAFEKQKADFASASLQAEKDLAVIKKNAASCGMIGGMVADKMDEAIAGERKQRENILATLKDPANAAVAKKAILEAKAELDKSNAQLASNLSMVQMGLSTETPTCRAASAAFNQMAQIAQKMPARLNNLAKAVPVKTASLADAFVDASLVQGEDGSSSGLDMSLPETWVF